MNLAANLKKLRVRKGKSLQEVADAVKVSKPHIWQLEKGDRTNPSLELIEKLSKYYETTISSLVGETQGAMLFGREFKPGEVDDETEKLIVHFAEQLVGKKKNE